MTPNKILRKTFTLLMAMVVLLAASCKKDKNNQPDNGGGSGTQLIKIETGANEFSTLEYDAAGKLIKIVENEDGESIVNTITYNGSKVTEVNTPGSKMSYTYNGNNVAKIDILASTGGEEVSGKVEYTYENNKVKQSVMSFLVPSEEEGEDPILTPYIRSSYEYYANGDIKKLTVELWAVNKWQVSESTVYEYDTKNNPLAAAGSAFMAIAPLQSLHNITKETVSKPDGSLKETVNYEYTYNNDGYPKESKKTVTPAGGNAGAAEVTKFSYK